MHSIMTGIRYAVEVSQQCVSKKEDAQAHILINHSWKTYINQLLYINIINNVYF